MLRISLLPGGRRVSQTSPCPSACLSILVRLGGGRWAANMRSATIWRPMRARSAPPVGQEQNMLCQRCRAQSRQCVTCCIRCGCPRAHRSVGPGMRKLRAPEPTLRFVLRRAQEQGHAAILVRMAPSQVRRRCFACLAGDRDPDLPDHVTDVDADRSRSTGCASSPASCPRSPRPRCSPPPFAPNP